MCTAWIKIVRMRQFLKATRLYDHFLSHFKRHQEKKKKLNHCQILIATIH